LENKDKNIVEFLRKMKTNEKCENKLKSSNFEKNFIEMSILNHIELF
jgi:hypothetical protein